MKAKGTDCENVNLFAIMAKEMGVPVFHLGFCLHGLKTDDAPREVEDATFFLFYCPGIMFGGGFAGPGSIAMSRAVKNLGTVLDFVTLLKAGIGIGKNLCRRPHEFRHEIRDL
jgi:hypothetical protein